MTKRTRLLVPVGILVAIVAGASAAVAAEHEALIGRDYASVRKILIKKHWVPSRHTEVHTTAQDRKIQRKYPEMERCAMDKPVCSFSFKKTGKCMRIITWGEELESFSVNAIAYDCAAEGKR